MTRAYTCRKCSVMFSQRPNTVKCLACGFRGAKPRPDKRRRWYVRVEL